MVVETSVEPLADPLNAETMRRHGIQGLHPGCGGVFLERALNTDRAARTDTKGGATAPGQLTWVNGFLYLAHDSTEPLPIEDQAFEWVFSEAFLEHITPRAGIAWLADMRRLLKPGGYLRLSTPDLRKYAEGYVDPEGSFYEEHRARLREVMVRMSEARDEDPALERRQNEYYGGKPVPPARRGFMFNQIFRFWGHKWIYDLDELRHAAVEAGFPADAVVECAFRQGRDPRVAQLDDEGHSDESMYVEIVKE